MNAPLCNFRALSNVCIRYWTQLKKIVFEKVMKNEGLESFMVLHPKTELLRCNEKRV